MKITLPENARTVAIVDTQWGDTGKGKFVDLLAEWADIIARGTGGANAGHSICCGGESFVFNLIPSGILRDADGKINIIGSGVAVDPRIVCKELALLETKGVSYSHLRIAYNAKLVLPQHLVLDRVREALAGNGKIGTTGRGIGPVYADHISRIGLTVNDLFNLDSFARKLSQNLQEKLAFLKTVDPEIVKGIMHHEHLLSGTYYGGENIFNVEAIVEQYREYACELRDMVDDTDTFLRESLREKRILLEGAQGVLLSVDCGIQPHVTSSDCSLAGLAKGVGLHECDIDLALGIVKAFYMTRVGEGVFPTEIGGAASAAWCNTSGVTAKIEAEKYPNASVNDNDPVQQGVGIRIAGKEYGATTGRPRRTGWLDLPLLRYALPHASYDLILTKLDVLSNCERIRICTAYRYASGSYALGSHALQSGELLETAIPISDILQNVEPAYKNFPGWMSDISTIQTWEELPEQLKAIITFIEQETGARIQTISVGPDRNQTIMVPLFR